MYKSTCNTQQCSLFSEVKTLLTCKCITVDDKKLHHRAQFKGIFHRKVKKRKGKKKHVFLNMYDFLLWNRYMLC